MNAGRNLTALAVERFKAGGITHFGKVLLAEAIIILPTGVLAGINAVIGTVIAFVIACAALVYYNASCECKEQEAN